MNLKFIALTILYSIIILSCSKEEVSEENEDCELNYSDNVEILNSSKAALGFYGVENKPIFTDNAGIQHEFTLKKEEYTLWCLHSWVCENDTTQVENFWVKRSIKKLKYSSNSTNYNFNYSLYASLNHIEPIKYSDIMNIEVVIGSEHNCNVGTYIINQRTDNTATNSNLILNDSMEINNKIYFNVISELNEEFKINYNLEKGLLTLVDLNNEIEFVISE